MNIRHKRAAKSGGIVSPAVPSSGREPAPTRPPYDDGRCGGWLGPAPSGASDDSFAQWVKDTDR